MSRLDGKVALVTGGSRGIGAAIARRLAAEGADVALTYVANPERAEAVAEAIRQDSRQEGRQEGRRHGGEGRRAIAIAADNGDPAAVRAAVERTVEALGRLDILVNNAGVFLAKPFTELTLEEYEQTMAVNVRAVFAASQAAAAHLGEGGRIISLGSGLALRVPGPGLALYAASKAALVGLTKGMARDLGQRGITVNVVHPGPTDTDMNPAVGDKADAARTMLAIPRYGAPENIAGMVAYLASEEGRFVTGASLAVDGGFSA
ncbi:SDR family NAD(P)-dependent oxidoreductase [Azospirillum picis]|uniref:NAD(P)-dependent dehydrogenase (Short-subunit alcohol dehydrogenase family) n=1 Tax=Azospirillum picis TaxID=488438 RepID=A0ABU0MM55_9PROT|nr:3-oxoacyl-ACP reductase family protein [Azospirillum picis]MBP2300584.1 NAD(P)-dependent dehydrogenase (short-subunit alcohol dehydrogenase family) [Azospirillum picis]MDQ0534553.1 NAD(P)-dependent dehydrogenase (short-subunit alcohol dehydrogenase family) [Azospirillum picis]